jgi:hypothetical protein
VDGLALFGSRAADRDNPISDYDLLILVTRLPIGIFQMLTHIDRRIADIVFIKTETIDDVLSGQKRFLANSVEGMFLLKMRQAQIVYDASRRLQRAQDLVRQTPSDDWLLPPAYSTVYAAWFWQNHGLYQMKRMAQADDPAYLTAVDMMLLACLSDVGRAYHSVRHLPWQGEKAAVRYWKQHDPDYLALLRECLATVDRALKLQLYEALVAQALGPVGDLWKPGITAVYLDSPAQNSEQIDTALAFWESLLV